MATIRRTRPEDGEAGGLALEPVGDVATVHPFYEAIAWLVATTISTGVDVGGARCCSRPEAAVSGEWSQPLADNQCVVIACRSPQPGHVIATDQRNLACWRFGLDPPVNVVR